MIKKYTVRRRLGVLLLISLLTGASIAASKETKASASGWLDFKFPQRRAVNKQHFNIELAHAAKVTDHAATSEAGSLLSITLPAGTKTKLTKFDKTNIRHLGKALLKKLTKLEKSNKAVFLPSPKFDLHDLAPMTKKKIGKAIGWVADPAVPDNCHGYYRSPLVNKNNKLILPPKNSPTHITATQSQFFQKGTSILVGNVHLKQPGRILIANKAYLFRDPKTGKLTAADFYGDVHLYEAQRIMVGSYAHLRFGNHRGSVDNALYRLASKVTQESAPKSQKVGDFRRFFSLNAWGRAVRIKQLKKGVLSLFNTTYTTCTPSHMTWFVKAKHLVLNKQTGRGDAWHARLYVHNIPVFYTPYLNFPIDNRRQSGFLYPGYGYSSDDGVTVSLPYYWNMAPNYDMVITPVLMNHRGLQLNDHFRFLTERSHGAIYASLLPNDKAFQGFQSQANISRYPGRQADLNRLLSDSGNRYLFAIDDKTQLNPHWHYNMNFNMVSDDYYFEDFDKIPGVNNNQLQQQAELSYQGEHWNYGISALNYQGLHPIDQSPLASPYNQLPKAFFDTTYNLGDTGVVFSSTGESTTFSHHKTPGSDSVVPVGTRVHLRPSVALPMTRAYGYLTPKISVDVLQDYLQTQVAGFVRRPQRAIPIVQVGGGLYFDKSVRVFGTTYTQTLEPKVMYLYIPYHSQRNFPLFDTANAGLSLNQYFQDNRYTGIDRLGDANHLAVGATSRFIDPKTGLEKFSFAAAQVLYFSNRRVSLCTTTGCSDTLAVSPQNVYSPLYTQFTYQFDPRWQFKAHAGWLYNDLTPIVQGADFTYRSDYQHIFNVGYSYTEVLQPFQIGGEDVNREDQIYGNSTKQAYTSLLWPLPKLPAWSALGYASYDISKAHALGTFWGLEYNSCCWAMRVISSRQFTANDAVSGRHMYNNTFFLQFILKGLGGLGNHSVKGVLDQIKGFNDPYQIGFSSNQ